MAADASAKFGGFSLVYSAIFFYFEPFQFRKFTSSRTSLLVHSSFSEINLRQHFLNVNCIFLCIKKASIARKLISFVVKQGGEQTVIIPPVNSHFFTFH